MMNRTRDIQTLILSFQPLIAIATLEEERVQTLLQAVAQDMNIALFEWSITQGLTRSLTSAQAPWVNDYAPPGSQTPRGLENTTDPAQMLKYIRETSQKGIFWLKDLSRHLEDATVARQLREVLQVFSYHTSTIVLTGENLNLPPELARDAFYYDLKLPAREELLLVVREVIRNLKAKRQLKVEPSEQDIDGFVQALAGMTLRQARQMIVYAAMEDGQLTAQDVQGILHRKAQIIQAGGVLEYFPVENKLLNLGGFAGLKRWLSQAKVGYTPQAQALNLKPPKGILIVGVQGCGKSMAAKAIAQSWQLPLLKLDAGRLYDKYIGESERNFRQAIALAESMAPTVLWIDEIEKSFTTSSSDSDGGLSHRLFGSFLTWMQEKSQDVFVVATANDISQVPPELFRKGRFDEVFFVDLPNQPERGFILQDHLWQRKQDPQQFDLPALIEATEGFSGAEIEQSVISALYQALQLNQLLDTALLVQAIKFTIPLSVARREEVQRLQAIAYERFVSVR